MAEKPIIFSGPMVRAILDGNKTQTRRVVKPQPIGKRDSWSQEVNPGDRYVDISGRIIRASTSRGRHKAAAGILTPAKVACPYGVPGDLLWVRETQEVIEISHGRDCTDEAYCSIRVRYEADGLESGWLEYPERLEGIPVVGKCLSYGGYRESSRLNLKVKAVRIEKVQEIEDDYDDIIAEGISQQWTCINPGPGSYAHDNNVYDDFLRLWDSINAKRGYSWESNPWVWVVEFERAEHE